MRRLLAVLLFFTCAATTAACAAPGSALRLEPEEFARVELSFAG